MFFSWLKQEIIGTIDMGHLAVIAAVTFKNQSSFLKALPLLTKLFSLHMNQHGCCTCRKHFALYVQGSGRGRGTTA